MRDKIAGVLWALLIILILWSVVGEMVLAFRHPWMTETERILHYPDALMFRKLNYYDLRPRP